MTPIKYKKDNVIGSGIYGKVYEGTNEDGSKVAVKRFLIGDYDTNVDVGSLSLKEVDIYSRFKHPYISKLIDVRFDNPFDTMMTPTKGSKDDKLYLIIEKARFSLQQLIYDLDTPIFHMKRAMYQILSGLYYMHLHNTCHRDIKPANILCFYDNGILTAKLADFSLTKPITHNSRCTVNVVARDYRSPEILLCDEHYTCKSDIWSLGCLFFEMICNRKPGELRVPFIGNNEFDTMYNIAKVLGINNTIQTKYFTINFKEKLKSISMKNHLALTSEMIEEFNKDNINEPANPGSYEQFIDLLEKMLKFNPDDRLSAWECLNHEFFSKIPIDENDINSYRYLKLYKQPKLDIKYHILKRNDKLSSDRVKHCRAIMKTIDFIESNRVEIDEYEDELDELKPIKQDYLYNQRYRILFLSLDIYDRCLLHEIDNKHMNELMQVCIYLACKFLTDNATPSFRTLFPESCSKKNLSKIERLEMEVLTKLKYIVYRPIVFDLIDSVVLATIGVNVLFNYMIEGCTIYGKKLDEAISYIESNADDILLRYS